MWQDFTRILLRPALVLLVLALRMNSLSGADSAHCKEH